MTPLRNALLTASLCLVVSLNTPAQAENTTPPPDSLRAAAIEATKANQWPQSLEAWGRYLQVRPEDEEAWRKQGYALGQLDRHEEAIASYRRATELEPNSSWAWNGLCWHQILAGQFSVARPSCEKVLAIDPTSYAPAVNLGHIWLLEGQTETAYDWYRKTLPLITDEADLKEGPLADFDIFIKQGWKVEESRQARSWFEKEGAELLTRLAPADKLLAEADAAEKVEDYAQSIVLREQRLPLLTAILGENHPRITNAQKGLINTIDRRAGQLVAEGRYAEALPLYRQVLAAQENDLGPNHPRIAAHIETLAILLLITDHYAESESLYKRALAVREKALGPDHPDVASSLKHLAELYGLISQNAQAEQLYVRALVIQEKALGPEHPDVATSLNNLALQYQDLSQYAQAEPLLVRALAIREKVLSPEHPDVATSLNNLAELREKLGQYAEAELRYERALAIREKVLSPEHPDVASSLNNLAGLQKSMGQYAQAEARYVRALTIREKAFGPDHPDVASSLKHLAELYQSMGQYAQAEARYVRALVIQEKALGPAHPDVATSLNNLAGLYETLGQYAEADTLYHRALAIMEKAQLPNDRFIAVSLSPLAGLLRYTGRYAEAEPLYRRALAMREKTLPPDHPLIAISLKELAILLSTTGRNAEAVPLFTRAMLIWEVENEKLPDDLGALANLSRCYYELGHYDKAEPLLRRGLAIQEKILPPDHPEIANRLLFLSLLLAITQRYPEVEPLAQRAWRISLNTRQPRLLKAAQSNLSHIYAKLNRPDAAIFFGKQAVNASQVLRQNVAGLGKDSLKAYDDSIEGTYRHLSKLLITAGRLIEAERVLELLKEQEQFQFVRRDADIVPLTGRALMTTFEAEQEQALARAGAPLAKLYAERTALEDKPNRSAEEDARLAILRQAYEQANTAFQQTFEKVLGALNQVRPDKVVDIKEAEGLQGSLRELSEKTGENVVALYTVMEADSYSLILTTPDYRRAYTVPVKAADLNAKIVAWRAMLKQPSRDPRPLARELLDIVLPPAARAELQQAKVATLMWHLDGALRLLPLAALHDGQKYLVERYRMATFTQASVANLSKTPKTRWSGLGLGVSEARTVGGKDFKALPAVEQELAKVIRQDDSKGVVPGIRHLNQHFDWGTMQSELQRKGKYPLIHIASHFNLEPGNNTMSYLLPGKGEPITLAAIEAKDNLFGGVDLITLSACETAVGGGAAANGVEVDGLSYLSQRKGAKAVMATLWPVADASTAQLMQQFYSLREQRHLTKAEALRQAQLALLTGRVVGTPAENEPRGAARLGTKLENDGKYVADPKAPYDHPYYWAPFILMGNWL